jgi:hypothetical protein
MSRQGNRSTTASSAAIHLVVRADPADRRAAAEENVTREDDALGGEGHITAVQWSPFACVFATHRADEAAAAVHEPGVA